MTKTYKLTENGTKHVQPRGDPVCVGGKSGRTDNRKMLLK